MKTTTIADASAVSEGRRVAVGAAYRMGFDEEEAGRVAIVATELATNLIKHATRGELLVGAFDDASGSGIECLALDKGPGFRDFEVSLRDGHSTAGSAGTGLGAIHRGAHFVDVYSQLGAGTAILARMQRGRPPSRTGADSWSGAIGLAKPGEEISGDCWALEPHSRGFRMIVADGLGHGPGAAEAAQLAVEGFRARHDSGPAEILEALHRLLKPTRGAAIAVADVDRDLRRVRFAGVGNIAGTLVTKTSARQMVSHHGTVGHIAKRFQDFVYPYDDDTTIVMCSDGLATSWALDRYPGLRRKHPTLIGGVLYRDFTRGRDDVTVLAAHIDSA